jgi:hypothetical protein
MENTNINMEEVLLCKDQDEFLKTLNKLIPKSEFVRPEGQMSHLPSPTKSAIERKEMKPSEDMNENIKTSNLLTTKTQQTKTHLNKRNQNGTTQNFNFPRQKRINNIMRKLDQEFISQVKDTELKMRQNVDLQGEIGKFSKLVNDCKRVNRDEELLKMQKRNQDIDLQLKELKNKDKSELRAKEEQSRKLIEDLNNLFNEKKKEALDKDDERKKIIEEIKQIKKDQEDHKNTIKKYTEEKENLIKTLGKLDKDIVKLKCYQEFIDKVFESSNQNQNDGFTKLSNKFKELIESMETIQRDIAEQEAQIKQIKRQQVELTQKNDKQTQNKRLIELESEIKDYIERNKKLELEIEEIQKKNQKKDSDTYQIKLSINNLYMKCKYKETDDNKKNKKEEGNKDKKDFDMNVTDTVLCSKLTEINERIIDLVKIYKELEP